MVLQVELRLLAGRIVRRSMTKLFHPSSTLDGRSKTESFKRVVISVLSRLAVTSTNLSGCRCRTISLHPPHIGLRGQRKGS